MHFHNSPRFILVYPNWSMIISDSSVGYLPHLHMIMAGHFPVRHGMHFRERLFRKSQGRYDRRVDSLQIDPNDITYSPDIHQIDKLRNRQL